MTLDPAGDDLRALGDERVGFRSREVDVHAGAGLGTIAVDAGSDVALEMGLEAVEMHPAVRVEGGGVGEVEAGEGKVGHRRSSIECRSDRKAAPA